MLSIYQVIRLALVAIGVWATAVLAENAQPQFFQGFELLQAGKFDDAIAKFSAGLVIEPENAAGHFYLAEALNAVGRQIEAIKQYEESYRLDARGPLAAEAQAKIRVIERAMKSGNMLPSTSALPATRRMEVQVPAEVIPSAVSVQPLQQPSPAVVTEDPSLTPQPSYPRPVPSSVLPNVPQVVPGARPTPDIATSVTYAPESNGSALAKQYGWGKRDDERGLVRELLALEYISPAYPPGNYGVFSVRNVSISCPTIELEGRYIYSKARMAVSAHNVSAIADQPAITLNCGEGEHCIEIRPENRPAVFWRKAYLVADSASSARTLAERLRGCVR